ncbi:hypothetical protein EMCRGX_G007231 [Ephydatia muelleri]
MANTQIDEELVKEWMRDGHALHALCYGGRVDVVRHHLEQLEESDASSLRSALDDRDIAYGYAPAHVAAVSGHFAVLQLLLDKGGDVNCQSKNGFTPLHLAAHTCRSECVKTLVRFGADLFLRDTNGKTAKEVASLSTIQTYLSIEEIRQAVQNNMEVQDLLNDYTILLEPQFLDSVLITAVRNGHQTNACWLIIRGATDIDRALQVSANEIHNAVMSTHLMLMKAAITNDVGIVTTLYSSPTTCTLSVPLSTYLPIKMARRMGHTAVMRELLLRTGVNGDTVNWGGLQLLHLQIEFLSELKDVKHLYLSGNGLKTLPLAECFLQVKKLDLQQNDLVTIPEYILELPSLCELNLSRNKLEMLPKLTAWSISLLSLDLSHNKLSTIPGGVIAARIYSLNLSSNEFKEVPLCVCYFQTLHVLDLSNNKDIRTLPAEMGRLRRLQSLDLSGLTGLCDPPKSVTHDVNECISYLRNKLYCFKPFFCMKLVLLGMPNCGKTTLGRKLQGRECESETKVELDISEWNYKPNVFKTSFSFSVWDFVGTKEFFATYHCCLTKGSIYLVVFNVKNGRAALEEIQFWLTNLALSMPSSCVHIVGTHLDEVPKNERDELDGLLHEISGIASKFSGRLKIEQICAVGLGNEIQLVTKLKDSIYMTASEYKVGGSLLMGQMVPASYQTLNKSFSDLIMHVKKTIIDRSEFKSLIHDLGLNDIQTDDELDQITRFLTDIGTILHYNDPSNNLAKLYFVDPPWLCKMIYSTVKSTETDTCFINGIKDVKSVSYLLHKEMFPLEYFDQYITLLDRFEIALVLEESKILIPSQLSTMQPRALSASIIHRDVKASNVLVWSLDPMSLCHCKITDFGTAIFEAPNGAAGIEGTQSFVAPEVYSFGDCQKNAAYDHNIDIFSLAMLIYQAISRRNPFDKLSDANIITAVVQGVRPKIGAPPYIEHAFLYLSKLMQHCWNSDPRKRPGTKIVIKHICQSLVQSVMLIESLPGPFMLQHACIASESSEGGIQIMVWLDHPKNPVTEAHVLSIDAKLGRKSVHYTISGLIECVCQCGNYILVAPRVGFECGMINVFESGKREMIHSIATNRDESVCCMMYSKNKMYCGTSEGSCFSFLLDPQSIKSTSILWIKTISNYRIESIVAIQKSLWVSSSNQIHILNPETLDIIDTVAVEKRTRSFVLTKRDIKVHSTPQVAKKKEAQGYIGQLKLSFDNRTIWSCHLRHSSLLSAWSAEEKRCLSGVNITPILSDVYQDDKQNAIISAMAPVLDTVWVGTTSGHILVLKGDEPLLWFRPYKDYICFLECITQPGLCQTEEAMVVSGSKGLMPYMVENFDSSEKCDTDEKYDQHYLVGSVSIETMWSNQSNRETCCCKIGQPAKPKPRPKHLVKVHIWASWILHCSHLSSASTVILID